MGGGVRYSVQSIRSNQNHRTHTHFFHSVVVATDVWSHNKMMRTCEHETNDHSIFMSLILTLPLNKTHHNGSHAANKTHRLQLAMRVKRKNCTESSGMVKNKCDALWIEAENLGRPISCTIICRVSQCFFIHCVHSTLGMNLTKVK